MIKNKDFIFSHKLKIYDYLEAAAVIRIELFVI